MARAVKCPLCGEWFTTIHPRAVYCEACRSTAQKLNDKRWQEIRREERRLSEDKGTFIHTCDTPDRIAACLSCEAEECDRGTCKIIRKLRKGDV